MWSAAVARRSRAVSFLAQHRLAGLIAPPCVEEEVNEHLPRVASDTEIDPAQVMALC
jgi:hypothetical protein